ncbi:MAG: DUF5050 domain-containing protein [Candidatus Poribacteria bacterium]|nr:DUF5050 domain-containing protein [Candidatus Poribacteria bacterium]
MKNQHLLFLAVLLTMLFTLSAVPLTLGETVPYQSIYYVDDDTRKIQWANVDGTNIKDLVTDGYPADIALDVLGGKMYYTDDIRGLIYRADVDGSNVEDILTDVAPRSIALDVLGSKMYWTEWHFESDDKIRRANLDGSNVEDLVTAGLDGVWNIALDVSGGKMYWTNRWRNKIQRANLDGSNVEDIITNVHPAGIALDVANGKMYYTDWLSANIQRANFDGSHIQAIVLRGLREPAGIILDVAGDKMYWADAGSGKIQRANLDGSNVIDIITDLRAPVRLALGTTSPGLWDLDVNQDSSITYIDIIALAMYYGVSVDAGVNLRADVNKDGRVDIKDLIVVARAVDAAAAAPALVQQRNRLPFTAQEVAAWIRDAKYQQLSVRGIAVLEHVLEALTRSEMSSVKTALLANYPNPFNPETWIPYQLATPADVTLTISAVDGQVVRTLGLGHQAAGVYQRRSRAAYWDGRNAVGESVASGVYFYTLTAGDFTATRKLLIRK